MECKIKMIFMSKKSKNMVFDSICFEKNLPFLMKDVTIHTSRKRGGDRMGVTFFCRNEVDL